MSIFAILALMLEIPGTSPPQKKMSLVLPQIPLGPTTNGMDGAYIATCSSLSSCI